MNLFVELRANPLVMRSVRRPVRLSSRRVLSFTLCAALVVAALTVQEVVSHRDLTLVAPWILLTVAVMMIAAPSFVAYAASMLTHHELQSEQFELVHVTALSNACLLQGFVVAVLHRTRVLLLVMAGLVPFMIVGSLVYSGYMRCAYYFGGQMRLGCGPIPLPENPALWVLSCVLIFICFAGMILLSAVFGVLLAVLIRFQFVANMAAMVFTLIGTLMATVWVIGFASQPLPVVLQRAGLLLLIMLLAGYFDLRLARPFVRRRA